MTKNTHSVFVTTGASNHSKENRQDMDYYATPPKAVEMLLEKERFAPVVWENAVGGGHIADVLKNNGHNVICSDVVDRGYPHTQVLDFLEYAPSQKLDMDIITNPPYKHAKEFVEKSLEVIKDGHKVAMFLRLQFLEGQARRAFFEKSPPPRTIYVASGRFACGKNGEFEKGKNTAVAFAWFVWEKGFKGKPTIEWIN